MQPEPPPLTIPPQPPIDPRPPAIGETVDEPFAGPSVNEPEDREEETEGDGKARRDELPDVDFSAALRP